ncbi:MAG: threonine synthase [Candidatus Nanohaloarchaea archaeon]|nr:threonine synthase [Candidatus Nanohaloarchaea archaeon]
MFATGLRCHDCGTVYDPDKIVYRCDCGGSLKVVYDYDKISDRLDWQTLKGRHYDHHRYSEFFPVLDNNHVVAMGEGGTPLVEATSFGDRLGLDDLYFKVEGMNPTGSFKDRGTTVEIGKALDHGADQIVVASTGNMGASIAAYAARAGLPANIFIPRNVSDIKLQQMQAHGAKIHRVDGDYAAAAEQAYQAHEEHGWYLMGDYAYRGEGEKSVGFEIMDQLQADHVVLPVGNGTLMHGTYKGIREMERVGLIDKDDIPTMHGMQAAGCSTVARAFQEGLDEVPEEEDVDTLAGAIACGDPLDGEFALEAVRESGGTAAAFPDEKLVEARDLLAEEEGIYAEESCGAALAGILDDPEKFRGGTVVCVVTGHGLKT